MNEFLNSESPSRFLIGIDLGTTNSALAYVDTDEKKWTVRDLSIPQLVAPGMVEARQTLPSFLYESAAGEFAPQSLRLPWDIDDPSYAVGAFARIMGRLRPAVRWYRLNPGFPILEWIERRACFPGMLRRMWNAYRRWR